MVVSWLTTPGSAVQKSRSVKSDFPNDNEDCSMKPFNFQILAIRSNDPSQSKHAFRPDLENLPPFATCGAKAERIIQKLCEQEL
jgi:hypothetical protein